MKRFWTMMTAVLLAAGSLSVPKPAVAADAQAYREHAGACGEQRFLNRIVARFDYQVRHVPHLPQVGITDFRDIRERRYEPAEGEIRPIERIYCKATVELTNGRSRDIWYLIEGGMGFASIGDNVEFCVAGFDRWMVYNGHCRVLR